MKRVLIISYYWPPSGGSGVQRWVKFSKHLPSLGWQPVVYTPENPELIAVDSSLEAEIPAEVEVVRRHITEPYGILRALTGAKPKGKDFAVKGEVNPINSQKKSLVQKFSMWIRGNLFIPDPRCWWIGPSVRYLKKYLKEHPVDLIVSTGPPHSMHLIALRLSKALSLPWVADFRDPWTRMFYFKHLRLGAYARRRHRNLEQKVLDGATAVVAVSPLVREDFVRMTQSPVHLITNGFDEDDFSAAIAEKTESERFRVTHTGLFAADGNPDVLWTVLSEMCAENASFAKALDIRLCGKNDAQIIESICAAGLKERLTDLGYQDHMSAVREQVNASVLILPLRKEPEYKATLPGKLFEYLASLRPVLGIGQTDGAMAAILSETGAGRTCEWEDKDGMRAFIQDAWEKFKEGKLERDSVSDISQYSRKNTAAAMAQLFNELTDK